MDGGTVNNTGGGYLIVGGYQGTGTWNHNGGTINSASSPLVMGDATGSTGTFYLNGGVLNTNGVQAGITWDVSACTGNFYFNGGTLQAAATSSNFMALANIAATLNVYISAGGAKINTNGFNITITSFLNEDPASTGGGLTKLGSGTLTLTNPNAFTGNITVEAGTLMMNYPGFTIFSPTTTVKSGGTLSGSSYFKNVVVEAPVAGVRGNLAPGNGTNNTNLMDNLTMTSAQLNYLIHTTTDSSLIDVSTGIVNVSTSAGLKNQFVLYQDLAHANETTAGEYPLIKCGTLTLPGGTTFADNFSLPNPYIGDFDASINVKPDLSIGPTGQLIYLTLAPSANGWKGPSGGLYSAAGNWKTIVPNASGAKALFAGDGTPPSVLLDINPQVGKIVFNNPTSYTISTANASRFILNAGAGVPAEIDDLAGSHTIAVGLLMAKDTTFVVSGASDTLTVSGAITGANNNIIKDGPGTLLLSNNNGFGSTTGGTTVLGGTIQLDGTNSYVGATKVTGGTLIAKVIANAGVASSIGAAGTSPSNLALDNATLQYTGAAAVSTTRGITLTNAVTIDTAQNLNFNGSAVMGTTTGPDVTLNTPGAGTITLGGQVTSAGIVTKTGTGTLKYTASSGVVSSLAIGSNMPTFVIQNGNVLIAGADNTTQYNVAGGELCVGWTVNSPISLTIQGGTINVGTWLSVGKGNLNTSTLTVNGGVINTATTSMGWDNGQSGYTGTQILNMNNNSVYTNTGTPFYLGESGGSDATVNISGTAQLTTTTGPMWVGNAVGAKGTLNIKDSAQVSVATFLSVGLNGTGIAKIEGATSRLSVGNDLNVGDAATAVGTLDVLGGTVQSTNLWVGRNGTTSATSTGTVNQSGGAVVTTNLTAGGGTAIYNLDGGSVTANIITKDPTSTTGTGTLNFNGGVLKAGAADNPTGGASTYFLTGLTSANVKAGGAIIDTNSLNVTINQILAADTLSTGGGLTKQGLGTLTITQNATYTGNTTVSAGILDALNINTPSAAVSVAAGSNELIASSIVCNSLTVGAGATVVIKPIPGGPLGAGYGSLTSVPEPGILVLLTTAALAILAVARKRY